MVPPFGGCVEGEKGFAALRGKGTPHKVKLATRAAERRPFEMLGISLPEEVDLQHRVDGDHCCILGGQSRRADMEAG
jgi:hypothetical protein